MEITDEEFLRIIQELHLLGGELISRLEHIESLITKPADAPQQTS